MDLEKNKSGKATVLRVRGRMDANTAVDFEKRCFEMIAAGEINVVADLSNLEFISSAGLRSILAVGKRLKGANGDIVFCGLKGLVKEVFDISGFNSIFQIYDTVDQALSA